MLMAESYSIDTDLAKLVSYLTFDGHLAEDLKCFYLSCKHEEILLKFGDMVYSKFGVTGRFEKREGYAGESYKYRVFSKDICRFLEKAGVPRGCKVKKCFSVPIWIKNNREFCRAYLKVAFDCEGSIWLEKQPKVRFGIFKSEEYMENNWQFVEEIKSMLNQFNISSTNSWLMKGNKRKDGKTTKGLYFKIKQGSLQQFAKEIGFTDNFKNQRLSRSLSCP